MAPAERLDFGEDERPLLG
jgi:hypothetical protein